MLMKLTVDLLDNASTFPLYSFQSHFSSSSNNLRTEFKTNKFSKRVSAVHVDPKSDLVIDPERKPDPDSLLSTTGNTSLPDSSYSGSSTTPDVVGHFNSTTTNGEEKGRKDFVTSSAPKIKIERADDNDGEVFLDGPGDQCSSPDRLSVQEQKTKIKHSASKVGSHLIPSNKK